MLVASSSNAGANSIQSNIAPLLQQLLQLSRTTYNQQSTKVTNQNLSNAALDSDFCSRNFHQPQCFCSIRNNKCKVTGSK